MRAVFALVLLTCLALAGWLLSRSTQVPVPHEPSLPDAVTSRADAPPPTAATENLSPPAIAPAEKPAQELAHEPRREAVEPSFAGPSAEVLVVHFGGQDPVAGASVYCQPAGFDWNALTPEQRVMLSADRVAFFEQISPTIVTDEHGRCRVPIGEHGSSVHARFDAYFGETHVPADAKEPTVLAVRIDRTLRVLVCDAAGRPAREVKVLAERGGDEPQRWQLGLTGVDGRIEYRHLQRLAGTAATCRLELAAVIAGGRSAEVTVEATAPPAEVVLHLPVTGSVTVHVRDAEGQPIDATLLGNPQVRLATFAEKPTRNAEVDALNRDPAHAGIDEHGDAVFANVVLGCHVMADVGHSLRSAIVPGPTHDQRHLELTLRESADDVVFIGVLQRSDGTPVAASQFYVSCRYGGGGLSGQNAKTDPQGRFRVNLRTHPAGQTGTLMFDTKFARDGNPQAIELPPRKIDKGHNDLGVVELGPHQLLIGGRLVAEAGVAVRPLQLDFERQQGSRWQQEWNLQPAWQPDGSFAVYSPIAKGTAMRLLVRTNSFLAVPPIEFAAGDEQIEVPLRTGGSVAATFLADANAPVQSLLFRLQRTEPPQKAEWQDRMMERHSYGEVSREADGRLRREWQGLTAGRYRLQVLCTGIAEPIAEVDALEVAGGACADPRLGDIDLRGRLRTFVIRALDADGAPIVSTDAFVVLRSAGNDWSGFHLGKGEVKIVAPGAVDLIVMAKGHVAALVQGVAEPRTIALQRAAQTHLQVVLPTPLPEGAQLFLRILPEIELPRSAQLMLDTGRGMQVEDFFTQEAVVAADGTASVAATMPGTCRIEARLTFGRGGTYVRDFEPSMITLPASGVSTLRVGEQGLARALQAARR